MTPVERNLMRHALGLNQTDGKSAYRNAFVTQRDSATGQVWEALVARGLAEARDSYEFGDMTVYHVTDLGRSKT